MSAVMLLRYPLGVLLAAFLAFAGLSSGRGLLRPAPELRVLSGYTAQRYATGLSRPTAMAFGPDGRLYVAQETGQIVVVGVGSAKPRVLARGFHEPLGLAWSGPRLFISSRGRLDSLNLVDKTLRARRTLLKGLPNGRHQQDNVVVGDGWPPLPRIGIDVRRLQGEGREERDDPLRPPERPRPADRREGPAQPVRARVPTWDRPPVRDGERPRRSRRGTGRDARRSLAGPQLRLAGLLAELEAEAARRQGCAGVTPPVAYLEPHSAAGGVAFAPDGRTAYVALWGTYFGKQHGRTVVRLTFDAAGHVVRQEVFARGFDHPLAVLVARDGALLVSDWGTGRIYRIAR